MPFEHLKKVDLITGMLFVSISQTADQDGKNVSNLSGNADFFFNFSYVNLHCISVKCRN